MQTSYQQRRAEIEHYFDRTAADAWSRLTSTEPVGRIRQSVREGRDRMRETLLGWLPDNLDGQRVLDAGCGTGALAVEAALRGADVVAVDLSPTLIQLARERQPDRLQRGRVEYHVGDMDSLDFGEFDHIVAMDSLIHYSPEDATTVLANMAAMTRHSILFTFAPYTPILGLMHAVGKFFPRADRAPSIVPVALPVLRQTIKDNPSLTGWQPGRTRRINGGFYKSQAFELLPAS